MLILKAIKFLEILYLDIKKYLLVIFSDFQYFVSIKNDI